MQIIPAAVVLALVRLVSKWVPKLSALQITTPAPNISTVNRVLKMERVGGMLKIKFAVREMEMGLVIVQPTPNALEVPPILSIGNMAPTLSVQPTTLIAPNTPTANLAPKIWLAGGTWRIKRVLQEI